MKRWWFLGVTGTLMLLLVILLIVHRKGYERGFNLLQSRQVALENPATIESLKRMRRLGANTVALVPFLHQADNGSEQVSLWPFTKYQSLERVIGWAHELGMRVILKPQILVGGGGWAGTVRPSNWATWFRSYGERILAFADLAQRRGVEELVVGTELVQAAEEPEWEALIAEVRRHYSGRLSYVAHGVAGLEHFAYWSLLDSAGVSLYPALGTDDSVPALRARIRNTLERLSDQIERLPVPLWIAEIGIASRRLAHQRPWAWQDLGPEEQAVDLELQKKVLALWLDELVRAGLDRKVLLWAWYNDPEAGGSGDNGFTIQNKPAEEVVQCYWEEECG
ncbi:hypothetical protein [Alcanivorax sp.]|uniref:glycoside hydrolase family 113 n=1 Tax=Alcanivorax sp. TaxID=1872427 RepID=UPI00258680EE|nr:hypothetical protein [Alcanivorax sp.]